MSQKQDLADRVDELEQIVDAIIDETGVPVDKTDRGSIEIPNDG